MTILRGATLLIALAFATCAHAAEPLVELSYEIIGPAVKYSSIELSPQGKITHSESYWAKTTTRRCKVRKADLPAVMEKVTSLVRALPDDIDEGEAIMLDGPSKAMWVRWNGEELFSIWHSPDDSTRSARQQRFADTWTALETILRCPR